ncbi:MAG: NineTeen Complex (NTC) component [Icmadophila ericetorum]|nr:NineTeen Complex (NTC) component [Icmadophila ericetorum]
MAIPMPPVPLDNHCSVIYNNTLYAYQASAFQSLPLQIHGQWSQLPMGVAATGAQCVQASLNGDDVLYIIGGQTNSTDQSYSGLQAFHFADGSWQTCSPQPNESVVQNRLSHGAVLLNSTSTILVYGGYQDDSGQYTSQTFTFSTTNPYNVQSFSSQAPPVKNPLLVQWNSSHAALLGGTPTNRNIWLFSEAGGWESLPINLPITLHNKTTVQVALVQEVDGSKLLEVFDESQSPNSLETYIVGAANGQPPPSGTVSSPTASASGAPTVTKKQRRQESIPTYNSTLAPTATRNNFSLAQSNSGLVVISGGNDQNPIALFNQTSNSWMSAENFFNPLPEFTGPTSSTLPSVASSIPSSTSSASASASISATAVPAVDPNAAKNHALLIVGATLGAIFGSAAIFLIALLLIRYLRQRQGRERNRRNPREYSPETKGMDFHDRGLDVPPGNEDYYGHRPTGSDGSMVSARGGDPSQQSRRGLLHKAGDSNGSAKSFFGRSKSPNTGIPLISSPQLQDTTLLSMSPERAERPQFLIPPPEARTGERTNEGWSQYFVGNETTDLAHISPAYDRNTTSTAGYTNATAHESAEVAPLNIRASQLAFSPEETDPIGLDTFNPFPVTEATPSRTREPPTPSTQFHDEDDAYLESSSGQESWTPVATGSERGSTWDASVDRASSVYTDYPHPGERVRIPNFPPVPSNRNSQVTIVARPEQTVKRSDSRAEERGLRSMASRDFAGGVSRSPKQDEHTGDIMSRPFPRRQAEPIEERSESDSDRERKPVVEGDMSWLNLGR